MNHLLKIIVLNSVNIAMKKMAINKFLMEIEDILTEKPSIDQATLSSLYAKKFGKPFEHRLIG